jgi:hypothetical protein
MKADTKVALAKLQNQFDQSERRAQAEIEHSEFVTRAHFDTEFEAMKQVFSCLAKLNLCINGIRPMITVSPTDEADHETRSRLEERLETFGRAYDALLNEAEAKLPFYSEELDNAVEDCQRAAWSELNAIRTSGHPLNFEGLEEGERNRNRFSKGYRKAANLIRHRLSRLAILPG